MFCKGDKILIDECLCTEKYCKIRNNKIFKISYVYDTFDLFLCNMTCEGLLCFEEVLTKINYKEIINVGNYIHSCTNCKTRKIN